MNYDPLKDKTRCEKYLSRALNNSVKLVNAIPLKKSTRNAPIKLTVEQSGEFKSYVLRYDSRNLEHEYNVLKAIENLSLCTPCVYGWDPDKGILEKPSFIMDFIEGDSLLKYLKQKEKWAEDLFIETTLDLQSVTHSQLSTFADQIQEESALDVLETAHKYFTENPEPLAEIVYNTLKSDIPPLPDLKFSNGDLYADNILVKDKKLSGIIDFEHAGFSDPIYEFLLTFFIHTDLRGQGIEERFCREIGYDSVYLDWYYGLEYFDIWHWVAKLKKPFEQYNEENLKQHIKIWLKNFNDYS